MSEDAIQDQEVSGEVTEEPVASAETESIADETADPNKRIADLEMQIASLLEAKSAADEAAELARLESMTEAEKLEARVKSLDERENSLKVKARKAALKRLGVMDKYHDFAPVVDVDNSRDAAKLEAWVKDNPELLKPVAHKKEPSLLDMVGGKKASSRLADILSGKVKSSLISAESAAEMLSK